MNAFEQQTESAAQRFQVALETAMASVEKLASARWVVRVPLISNGQVASLRDGQDHLSPDLSVPPLQVEAADGFLILSAELGSGLPVSEWELLKANGFLGGLVKFSSAPGSGLSIRAEIPLESGQLELRLRQACRGFAAAMAIVSGSGEASETPVAISPIEPPASDVQKLSEAAVPNFVGNFPALDVQKLSEEAGWPASSRRADRCAIPLDTRRGAHTALLSSQNGRLELCTVLASWDALSNDARSGLAAFLLAANSCLCLARTVVTDNPDEGSAQLQVSFELPATAADLNCALEALSVGADLCAPPAELLPYDVAAKLFLSVRGGPREAEGIQPTNQRILCSKPPLFPTSPPPT